MESTVFAEFYAKFYGALVMRLKRGFQFSHEDAEDVVQTALTRLWAKNPTFAGIDDVERYVFKCVKSAALDYRKALVNPTRSAHSFHWPMDPRSWDSPDLADTMVQPGPSIEDRIIARMQIETIAQQMGELPQLTQMMLRLSIEGLGYEAIRSYLTEQYGATLPVKTINSRLTRARHELRVQNHHQKAKGYAPSPKQQWSSTYAACIDCGKTEQRHAAAGRCMRCYSAIRHRQIKQQAQQPTQKAA